MKRFEWRGRGGFIGALLAILSVGLGAAGCAQPAIEEEEVATALAPVEHPSKNLFSFGDQVRAARAAEDWALARDIYLEALELAPRHPSVLRRLTEMEARLSNHQAVLAHLESIARLGATTDLIDDPLLEPLAGNPDFEAVAARLRENGAPLPEATVRVRFDTPDLGPEGIAWDEATGDFYVGSFGYGKLVRIGADGQIGDFGTSPDDNLGALVGVWVDSPRRELWVASGNPSMEETTPPELVRYNLESGQLVARYPAPDDGVARLLNDVVVTPDGTAWITESLEGALYRVSPDSDRLELFALYPWFGFVNGITANPEGTMLYLAHAEGVTAVDPSDGSTTRVEPVGDFTLVGADGLSWHQGALVLVQNQPDLNNRIALAQLDADGLRALSLEVLPSGLPDGLLPYTSASAGDEVYVVASPPIGAPDSAEDVPPPAIVRVLP